MIHVVTVHWRSDRWIDLQLAAFARCLPEPYLVYAFLNDLPDDCSGRFFYASREPIMDHATKLNLLADMARLNAKSDNDILVFIDGDAFPIAPLHQLIADTLSDYPLVAVQRYENNGDLQPHPCFCITTVGFWKAIGGDWHKGGTWVDLDGHEITDVGGNLLAILQANEIDWRRLNRVNRVNPDPLFFGVYGDDRGPFLYHHGAGFRGGTSRIGSLAAGGREARTSLLAQILDRLPPGRVTRRIRRYLHPLARLERKAGAQADRLSEEWFGRLSRDPEAWRAMI